MQDAFPDLLIQAHELELSQLGDDLLTHELL